MTKFTQNELMPSAYITKKRQRVKQFNDTVYLENNDEFEIELFNPTITKYLAEIKINNNSIGIGIILRPGERVFLERFTDDQSKKFCFKTYTVEGNNIAVRKAIENNGNLEIKFYKEIINQVILPLWKPYYPKLNTPTYDINYTTATSSYVTDMLSTSVTNFCCSNSPKEKKSKIIETGRVEKGSVSNQKFNTDYNSEFSIYSNHIVFWKILPKSSIHNEDIIIYCGKCGAKRKRKNHAFCPICGEKY
jgi:hypothetical protein